MYAAWERWATTRRSNRGRTRVEARAPSLGLDRLGHARVRARERGHRSRRARARGGRDRGERRRGLAWGVRAGRTLPLAPVCAAVGAWLALSPARARGDDRALATLGRSPWQREAAADRGEAAVAIIAAAAIAIAAPPRVDVTGFYPRAEESMHFHRAGDGASFVSGDGRWRVDATGAPSLTSPPLAAPPPSGIPPRGRAAAALATAALGLALPMLIARARSRRAAAITLAAIGAGSLATLLAFQAAAAALLSPLAAELPPLLLLAVAVSRYRAGTWARAKYPG